MNVNDCCELRLFEMYLRRRAEKPDEPQFVSYGAIYGETVFEDMSFCPYSITRQPCRCATPCASPSSRVSSDEEATGTKESGK